MCRVAGTRRSRDASCGGGDDETPAFLSRMSNLHAGTPVGGQFGWGATRSKRYRACPMVTSGRSEISRRLQGEKVALLGLAQQQSALRKQGLANHPVFLCETG
jgi:hypothetical protein